MGVFDTVLVNCPTCGKEHQFQSKGGDCLLRYYRLDNAPDDVLDDVNRHSPYECEDCKTVFHVCFQPRAIATVLKR